MESAETPEKKKISLGEHLEELRMRLIFCVVAVVVAAILAFVFEGHIEPLLTRPVKDALIAGGEKDPRIRVFQWAGTLLFKIKVSLVAGLLLASPVCVYQIWKFVSAGLYRRERKWVYVFGPFSLLLFLAGVVAGYVFLLPISLGFLLNVTAGTDFQFIPEIRDSLNFVLSLPVAMGIVFELPLVMFFLNLAGIVSVEKFSRWRKYFILSFFIIGAFLSPPDVISQIGLALPMILLFEGGLVLCKLFGRENRRMKAGDSAGSPC